MNFTFYLHVAVPTTTTSATFHVFHIAHFHSLSHHIHPIIMGSLKPALHRHQKTLVIIDVTVS